MLENINTILFPFEENIPDAVAKVNGRVLVNEIRLEEKKKKNDDKIFITK